MEPTFFIYLGVALLSLVFTGLIVRWAVRADSIVKNQELMIHLMIQQYKKQGASEEEIQKLKDHFRIG